MTNGSIPGRDVELLLWAKRFADAVKPYVEQHRIGKKEYSDLVSALSEYGAAVEEHERAAELVQATTMAKAVKKAPLERVLESLASVVKYDNEKGLDPNFDGKDPEALRKLAEAPDEEHPPSISLISEPGRVLVHFGRVPKWASGVCIYRRAIGETEYKMLRFAKSSPYVDEISDGPAKYEYMARYWLRHENRTGDASEAAKIEAPERIAA